MLGQELTLSKRVVLQTSHGYAGTVTGLRAGEFRVTYDGTYQKSATRSWTIPGGRFWYPLSSAHMFIDIKDAIADVLQHVQGEQNYGHDTS